MNKKIFLSLFLLSSLNSKELFTPEKISEFLNEQNPFFETLFNSEKVAKEKVKQKKSSFDTRLSGKIEDKEYPKSVAEYDEVFVKKKFENGLEFLTGYRKSIGTQEYNNIKTGEKGEMLFGLKIPIFQFFGGSNRAKTDLEIANLESLRSEFNSKDEFRKLYLQIIKSYFSLLENSLVLDLEEKLYEKAKKRKEFIEKRVKNGSLPRITLIEIQQTILNRENRVLSAKRDLKNSLREFVKFLNISVDEFNKKFYLDNSIQVEFVNFNFDEILQIAKENRPDLKMLDYQKEKFQKELKNAKLLKYPDLDLSLYGVHDFKYGDGFKVSLNMNFPIEQNQYEGKLGETLQNLGNIRNLREKKIVEISTAIQNTLFSLETLRENLENRREELELVRELEKAENLKYEVGTSNLFFINAREVQTLQIEKTLLQEKFKYLVFLEKLRTEIGYF
jgi:outer membrane protein TolC